MILSSNIYIFANFVLNSLLLFFRLNFKRVSYVFPVSDSIFYSIHSDLYSFQWEFRYFYCTYSFLSILPIHPVILIQLVFVFCPDLFFLLFLSSHIFLILFHERPSILSISNWYDIWLTFDFLTVISLSMIVADFFLSSISSVWVAFKWSTYITLMQYLLFSISVLWHYKSECPWPF